MAIADLLTLQDEDLSSNELIELFDPIYTWKKKRITNFYTKDLLVPIFKKGTLVYTSPSVLAIRDFAHTESARLWPEVLRLENPHTYYVDLSEKLWSLKQDLLNKYSNSY